MLTGKEKRDLDNHITGNQGEDSVPPEAARLTTLQDDKLADVHSPRACPMLSRIDTLLMSTDELIHARDATQQRLNSINRVLRDRLRSNKVSYRITL